MQKKPNILFIASNIPTPTRKSNPIVLDIADLISPFYEVSVIHPKEIAPFPLNKFNKYKHLDRLPDFWTHNGFPIFTLPYYRLPGFSLSFSLLQYAKQKINNYFINHKLPDITHAHFVLPDGYFAYMIYKKFGIPYVISLRGSDVKYMMKSFQSGFQKKKYDRVIHNATRIITHNSFQRDFIFNHYQIECQVIPHGIESSFLEEKKLIEKKDTLIITVVGSLISLKRNDWVIKAVQAYSGSKKITLRIVGDGFMRTALEQQAGNADNIIFYGQQPHKKVGELLHESDIFALPSARETFGLVYLEAAAKMNAVIAVKDTGVWGVFKENEEMLFANDYPSFEKKLHFLIDHDKTRIALAEKAYERTKNHYTWNHITANYHAIYEKILKKRGKG